MNSSHSRWNGEFQHAFESDLVHARTRLLSKHTEVTILRASVRFLAGDISADSLSKKTKLRIGHKVKTSRIGTDFDRWFLQKTGKTESHFVVSAVLCSSRLQTAARDLPDDHGEVSIISELGGDAKAETFLFEMISLLQKQGRGEPGPLLSNGHLNIFYIRDQQKVLRSVCVNFVGDGWRIHAYLLKNAQKWPKGSLVFFRKGEDESTP